MNYCSDCENVWSCHLNLWSVLAALPHLLHVLLLQPLHHEGLIHPPHVPGLLLAGQGHGPWSTTPWMQGEYLRFAKIYICFISCYLFRVSILFPHCPLLHQVWMIQLSRNLFYFQDLPIFQILVKRIFRKRGGANPPPQAPLKSGPPKNDPPMTAYDPQFLFTKMYRYIKIMNFGKN